MSSPVCLSCSFCVAYGCSDGKETSVYLDGSPEICMINSDYATYPMPRSLPELSSSRSSKSSLHSSYQSDDNNILTYLGNFEEIGLEDDETGDYAVKSASSFIDAQYIDYRLGANDWWNLPSFTNTGKHPSDLIPEKPKQYYSEKISHMGSFLDARHVSSTSNYSPSIRSVTSSNRLFPLNRNAMPTDQGRKSPSPTCTARARQSSWQVNRERKTVQELEKEFDEDNGEDVPDECFLDNVPLSPGFIVHWTQNLRTPMSTSPNPSVQDEARITDNFTFQRMEGKDSSSSRPSRSRRPRTSHIPSSPDSFKTRPKSWTDALSDLGKETKELTEALEVYQEESKMKGSFLSLQDLKAKSILPELPPLRKTDIMVDPLPISREKEAVLSRTRPSWLPPKDPAEEKRHVKQYKKMMAHSVEADRKREAEKREKSKSRDDTAKSVLRVWEQQILPNWNASIRKKQTRELWWKGVAPRCRGKVWEKAIGNELGLTDVSFTAALDRAKALETAIHCKAPLTPDEEKKKIGFEQIYVDVVTTYPELKIFQSKGPLHAPLLDILKAYTMYRSDVGYVYGISNCAALLLLNLSTPTAAFIALSNLLNRPLPLSFHTSDPEASQRALSLLFSTLMNKSPRLHARLQSISSVHTQKLVFKDFFASMGTAYMSLDNATRLWDILLFEGDNVLVRAAAALLMSLEGKLFGAETPEQISEIMRSFPLMVEEEKWVNSIRRTY